MPGFILHMTASQILFEKYNLSVDRNAFEVGNLIPDSVSDKTESHFRNPKRHEKLMVYPDLNLFLDKYESLLTDSSCLGYYYHLFVDRIYAREYIPQLVSFHDETGKEVSERALITHAFIKRTQVLVPIKTFFSEEYYYGDFTKLNTYLINRFHLSTNFDCNVANPGLDEVDYADIKAIQKQLEGYLDVPEEAVKELRVFEVDDFVRFLEETAAEFREFIPLTDAKRPQH